MPTGNFDVLVVFTQDSVLATDMAVRRRDANASIEGIAKDGKRLVSNPLGDNITY